MKIKSKPGQHSITSFYDGEAVSTLEKILYSHRLVKPRLYKEDSWPNHDGFLEIVDDSLPKGIIFVQVKSLTPNRLKTHISFTFNDKFLAYCSEDSSTPILFIGVDRENEVAYWQEMTPRYVANMNNRTIHLDKQNIIAKNNSSYHKVWLRLCEEHKKAIRIYRERKERETQSPDIIPSKKKTKLSPKEFEKAKHQLQILFIDINLKYKYFYAFIDLLDPFYLDKTGEEQRGKLRNLFEITENEEDFFIKQMVNNGSVKIVGSLCLITNRNLAADLQKEMIDKEAIDIDAILNLFD